MQDRRHRSLSPASTPESSTRTETSSSETGHEQFVALDNQTEIPVGTQVDTPKGTFTLIAGLGGGRTNSADFNQGLFTILQQARRRRHGASDRQGQLPWLQAGGAKTLSIGVTKAKKRVRRLWGSGKGRFGSKGKYGAATVSGTKWLTQDRCDGTFVKVVQGVVRVRDFRKHKT